MRQGASDCERRVFVPLGSLFLRPVDKIFAKANLGAIEVSEQISAVVILASRSLP